MQIETRYARNGETTIAWTTAGNAPTDLLFIPGFISHVEHMWEQPGLAGFFERLMAFSRLLNMDRRGCGLSDPRSEAMSLEDEARDVLAVLDAAGSERAVLMGYTTGGPLAIATAALAPERVQAIVLYASMARARGGRRRRLDLQRGGAPGDVGAARRGLGDGRQPRADRPLARRRPADEGVDGAHGAPVLEPRRARAPHGLHRRAGHQRACSASCASPPSSCTAPATA